MKNNIIDIYDEINVSDRVIDDLKSKIKMRQNSEEVSKSQFIDISLETKKRKKPYIIASCCAIFICCIMITTFYQVNRDKVISQGKEKNDLFGLNEDMDYVDVNYYIGNEVYCNITNKDTIRELTQFIKQTLKENEPENPKKNIKGTVQLSLEFVKNQEHVVDLYFLEGYLSVNGVLFIPLNEYDMVMDSLYEILGLNVDFIENQKIESYLQNLINNKKLSPSSNPYDYIDKNSDDYQNILKQGMGAVEYFINLFKIKPDNGLRGYIMMEASKEILEERNNVEEGTYETPSEWFENLFIEDYKTLPSFAMKCKNEIEQTIYNSIINRAEKNTKEYYNETAVTVVAFIEKGNFMVDNIETRVGFVATYRYRYYKDTLYEEGGSIIPTSFQIANENGKYSVVKVIEGRDGGEYGDSIREMCQGHKEIAEDMINNGYENQVVDETIYKNLMDYIKKNNLEIKYLEHKGEKIEINSNN